MIFMIDCIIMTDCITLRSVALANKRTLLCAAASVLFCVCSRRSAVAGRVVEWMLVCGRLVPTATICRLTNTHTPRCGTEQHAHLRSVSRFPHPVCSHCVQSLSLLVQCSLAYCCRHSAIPRHLLL